MSYFDRKDLISLAKISSELGLHSDAIDYMKQVIKMSIPFNYDERNLLFSSYDCMRDNLFKLRRKVKRMKPLISENVHQEIAERIDLQFKKVCNEAIELTDNYWIKRDDNARAIVHYKSFKATQYYFLVFVTLSDDDVNKAIENFEEASKIAEMCLSPAHPMRISIAKYLSEIQGYMLDLPEKALFTAEHAYKEGLACLHEMSEELKSKSEEYLDGLKKDVQRWELKKIEKEFVEILSL